MNASGMLWPDLIAVAQKGYSGARDGSQEDNWGNQEVRAVSL